MVLNAHRVCFLLSLVRTSEKKNIRIGNMNYSLELFNSSNVRVDLLGLWLLLQTLIAFTHRGRRYKYMYNVEKMTCTQFNLLVLTFLLKSCSQFLFYHLFPIDYRVLKYDMQNLEIPTIHVLGKLAKSGIRVLVYRCTIFI